MEVEAVKLLTMAFVMAIGAIGPGLGIAKIATKSVESVGRNPDAAGKVQSLMILGIVFTESIAVFVLVVALMIKFL